MSSINRRELFSDTAKGMLLAGLGLSVTRDLGLAPAWAAEEPTRLTFGSMEPLVDFLAQTPAEKIIPACIAKIRSGTSVRSMVAAAALVNARAFGGEDYIGFHTLMALAPAWSMAHENGTSAQAALPVLKVLFRNANRLKERGPGPDTLGPLPSISVANEQGGGSGLRDAVRGQKLQQAEQVFAVYSSQSPSYGLDALMEMVDDGAEVHRTVLVAKSLELAGFVGTSNAHSLLRQSVHYCVKSESQGNAQHCSELRKVLPALLEKHRLLSALVGNRRMNDAWVTAFSKSVLGASPATAAEAVALALADGIHPDDIGEALALGSNHLVLRDRGRQAGQIQANKPVGSVHGDSTGVHSGDSTHSWRAIARAGNPRTLHSSLILAGYQLARDRSHGGSDILTREPVHYGAAAEKVKSISREKLAVGTDEAIRAKDQPLAAALVARMGELNMDPTIAKGILRKFATTEDGALHAEKYYRTACDDFDSTRKSMRWTHLAGLARVTASAYGFKAPGVDEATSILG